MEYKDKKLLEDLRQELKNYFDLYLSDTFLDRDRFTEKIEILD